MDERKVATAKALKGLFDEGVLNEIDFKREKTKLFSSPYVLNPTVIDGLRESKELLDLEVLDMAEYSRAKQSFLDATTVVVREEREEQRPLKPTALGSPERPQMLPFIDSVFSPDSDSDSCFSSVTDSSADESDGESVVTSPEVSDVSDNDVEMAELCDVQESERTGR
ncbi:hypothetical protein CYMTET_7275 [Cymbomonas tetramitiformis]|uniref:Uncharacterized protein n=1 Tax=Cymbomonas tetramitiformis TaxID=36881 RepID=A0AAE0LHM0_9CHLO|nr:hypothetical protein CYMTET_7275 [Cymbomonas tetramitiformis]